jgi:uncharacterized damage-inducible protein DinB
VEEIMTPGEIVALFEFNAWANRKVLGAAEALSVEQFRKELGSSFSSVRDTLVHIYGAEWIWFERLQDRSPAGFPDAKEFPDLRTLRTPWAEQEKSMLEYARRLSQTQLDEVMEYKTFSYGAMRNPRWQSMQHVVNHGSYHRGQVVTMLRQLEAKGVGTDLISFYREKSAAAGA